ncbi:MAG: VWA domain-containing protein, partial [Flavobacteriaceae bacterium]|nr:VWA domain-containing protein [Flavobacteriaceae bacterium]
MWNNIEYTNPGFLWLLLVIPFLALWYFLSRNKSGASLTLSNTSAFGSPSILSKLEPVLKLLRLLAISALIVALARPRITSVSTKTNMNKGIDIVMAIDVSASMLAQDLKPNRLEALKSVATEFVNQRVNDRIGIVIYAGESFTQTPITSDKRIVKKTIHDIQWGQLEGGT